MTKPTRATVKSFINKNRAALLISVGSRFDGMTDCVQQSEDKGFSPALPSDIQGSYTMGIQGAWFVGGGRDYIDPIQRDGLRGFRISNCCGSFELAVRA